jgi:cell division septation protein DedD
MNNLQRGIYQPLADKVPIYDLADEDPEEERSRAPLLVVIALVVLAAFAGVVWLAYNQGVERGRQGASLVITAPEGPVRIAPPDAAPATPFTGLNVYNDPVAPELEAKTSELAKQTPAAPAAATQAKQAAVAQAKQAPPATAEPPAIRLSQAPPVPTPAPQRPAAAAPAPAAKAPAAAPAPAAPPAQTTQAARPPQPAAAPPPSAAAPAGASRALSGAAVLQLGAFESQELANGAWATFRSRYEALGQLAPDVQRADLGAKGVVFRLRAGPFADRTAAADACAQLKAAGGNCFVTAP